MSPDPVDESAYAAADDVNAEKEIARNRPLTRPRPGHADLVGMQKYGFEDARPVLERASARETAAQVALGAVASFLDQAYGIGWCRTPWRSGRRAWPRNRAAAPRGRGPARRRPGTRLRRLRVRRHGGRGRRGRRRTAAGRRRRGGRLRRPAGPRLPCTWDRRLDAQLAAAMMGIQAIKEASRSATGSPRPVEAHRPTTKWSVTRRRGDPTPNRRSGGTEGVCRPVRCSGEGRHEADLDRPALARHRRRRRGRAGQGDPPALRCMRSPAAGVVAEMVALVLAQACVEKFGGDSVTETARNHDGYLAAFRAPPVMVSADRRSPSSWARPAPGRRSLPVGPSPTF